VIVAEYKIISSANAVRRKSQQHFKESSGATEEVGLSDRITCPLLPPRRYPADGRFSGCETFRGADLSRLLSHPHLEILTFLGCYAGYSSVICHTTGPQPLPKRLKKLTSPGRGLMTSVAITLGSDRI
jgi:hypothetical protein